MVHGNVMTTLVIIDEAAVDHDKWCETVSYSGVACLLRLLFEITSLQHCGAAPVLKGKRKRPDLIFNLFLLWEFF